MPHGGIVQYPRGAWVIKQFGDGPARVWEANAEVPKLRNVAKFVVYLFGSLADARADNPEDPEAFPENPRTGEAKAASGCLIEVPTSKSVYQYVVTNRHVVQNGCVIPRFSFKDPTADYGYALDVVETDWSCDLLETDLAILPLVDETIMHGVRGMPLSVFLNEKWLYDVAVGDDVAMSGRFYPVSGGAQNQPVARFGNIARWPATPVRLSWMRGSHDIIPVEMRSHSGYSGSPAFVQGGINETVTHMVNEVLDPNAQKIYRDLDWPQVAFLGIDCGHLGEHMAAIIPWFKVLELLNSPVLVADREKRDASLPPMVIPDSRNVASSSGRTNVQVPLRLPPGGAKTET